MYQLIFSNNDYIPQKPVIANESAVYWSHDTDGNYVTRLDWFRICGYGLFYTTTFYTKFHIYEFSYTLDTVLNQFLETETSERCLICIGHRLRFSGFILYTLNFSFTVPLMETNRQTNYIKG